MFFSSISYRRHGSLEDGRSEGVRGGLLPLRHDALVRQLGLGLGCRHIQEGVEGNHLIKLLRHADVFVLGDIAVKVDVARNDLQLTSTMVTH